MLPPSSSTTPDPAFKITSLTFGAGTTCPNTSVPGSPGTGGCLTARTVPASTLITGLKSRRSTLPSSFFSSSACAANKHWMTASRPGRGASPLATHISSSGSSSATRRTASRSSPKTIPCASRSASTCSSVTLSPSRIPAAVSPSWFGS
ncbi:hypothetical protein SY88_04345 [Clostridiales bacterium PH28_bin88]|nr:hypothetical protein SY88_04345 [Clostridiales bacterium PH28_bin88]